jgi:hypothetical protein
MRHVATTGWIASMTVLGLQGALCAAAATVFWAIVVRGAEPQTTTAVVAAHVVAAARAFYGGYDELVASEHYTQSDSSSESTIDGDLLALKIGGVWMGVRDVHAVNGRQRSDGGERAALLVAARNPVDFAATVARDAARFNKAGVLRTANNPAALLGVFEHADGGRMAFANVRHVTSEHDHLWVIDFRELRSPTLLHTRDGSDVPLRGSVWLSDDWTLKRVQLTADLMSADDGRAGRTMKTTIWLAWDATVAHTVPTRMLEEYLTSTGWAFLRGEATYDHYRRFQVATHQSIPTR